MPIRPEMKDRYPKDWKAIRARILERTGHKCEKCGRPNGEVHAVKNDGAWCAMGGDRWFDAKGEPIPPRDKEVSCCEPMDWHATKTCLTIAHLDHVPEHCDPSNLLALCQRCHLNLDAKHHASNARRTIARKRGQGELPGMT